MPAPTGIFGVDVGPLAEQVSEWAELLLGDYLRRHPSNSHDDAKLIHDPIAKSVLLHSWEVYLIDSPLLQRLRGIRQLGVGHFLFPTAGYSRFEHSLGCVKAATTLFDAVFDEASRPQARYSHEELIARRDIVRLAALLHDIGHSVLSHVSEKFYAQDHDVIKAQRELKRYYGNTVAAAEAVAILIVRSNAFIKLLKASGIRRLAYSEEQIIDKVCACIAGSKKKTAPDAYLAEIVNGPVDCDKIDYLTRDAHMAGVPIALDIDRLLSKLRVVKVEAVDGRDVFTLAIVPSGARALEEMLVSRIFLYDKFYYHPKIMAAEELVRRALFYLSRACPALRSPATLLRFSDEAFLALSPEAVAAAFHLDPASADIQRGCELLKLARQRELPKRAFAFAQRFIPEMPTIYGRFVNRGKEETVAQASPDFLPLDQLLQSPGGVDVMVNGLTSLAQELGVKGEIFVGYQSAKRAAGKMDMPVLLPGNRVETTPDFLFNVSKWSDAYALNKQTSYVFAYDDLPKVHLAAERHFWERNLSFGPKSWVWTKISQDDLDDERGRLPETMEWSRDRIRPDYFLTDDAEERLSKLRAKFSSYLNAFDPELGPQLLDGWVWQFRDPDLQSAALSFLEYITFLEKTHIMQGFDRICQRNPELRSAVWVPLRPRSGDGKSADLVKYDLKELELEMCDIAMLTPEAVGGARKIVFFDDLLNSGVQAECLLGSWFSDPTCESPDDRDAAGALDEGVADALRKKDVEFAFCSAHPAGIARLSTACARMRLGTPRVSKEYDSSHARYTLDGFTLDSSVQRDRFVMALKSVGVRLLREKYAGKSGWDAARIDEFALGFGGLGMTILYRHSISTAVPVALWQMSTNIVEPWLPLFPRKAQALRRVVDPFYDRRIEDESLPEYRSSRDEQPAEN